VTSPQNNDVGHARNECLAADSNAPFFHRASLSLRSVERDTAFTRNRHRNNPSVSLASRADFPDTNLSVDPIE
jgi:hypothetical protein